MNTKNFLLFIVSLALTISSIGFFYYYFNYEETIKPTKKTVDQVIAENKISEDVIQLENEITFSFEPEFVVLDLNETKEIMINVNNNSTIKIRGVEPHIKFSEATLKIEAIEPVYSKFGIFAKEEIDNTYGYASIISSTVGSNTIEDTANLMKLKITRIAEGDAYITISTINYLNLDNPYTTVMDNNLTSFVVPESKLTIE